MSPILTVPHPVLRQAAKPVSRLDKKVLGIIDHLTRVLLTAKHPEGVGLAAPQVGVSLRLFLIRPTRRSKVQVFINPEIIKYSQALQSPDRHHGVYEGCLSLPHHYAPVTRAMSVTVKYQSLAPNPKSQIPSPKQISNTKSSKLKIGKLDLDWSLDIGHWSLQETTETFSGFPAHIIQHELDHLNGILFIDRVLEQNCPLFKVSGKSWAQVTI